MRRWLPAFPLLLLASAASAQNLSGPARAIDGDTLVIGGQHIRLQGMDAVEAHQTCERDGATWGCGQAATALLARLIDGRTVVCAPQDTDRYGRIVARCQAGGQDLGLALVEAGLAVALPRFSDVYLGPEARARGQAVGIWAGQFETPAAYRSAHAFPQRPRASAPVPAAPPIHARPAGVTFASCAEAWAAGAAPIYRGQPGYRPDMDGDGDGIACEPYRRK